MNDNTYICPQCRAEYASRLSKCADCGKPLVQLQQLMAIIESAREESHILPVSSELHCLREAPYSWAKELSERLLMSGIPHRIEDLSGAPSIMSAWGISDVRNYGIYVLTEDAALGAAIDAPLSEKYLPPDHEQAEVADAACPACGAVLEENAKECGICGLSFGG